MSDNNKKRTITVEDWDKKDFKDLLPNLRIAVKNLGKELNYTDSEIEHAYNTGKLKPAIAASYKNTPIGRYTYNDSPTKEMSESLEDSMNYMMYNRKGYVKPNMKYAIPYREDLEIKVPGVGRVPTNALDSLAKYAYEAKIPLEEALGLAAQETAFGAVPLYNVQSPNKDDSEEVKNKIRERNRALLNSSYFRNFGIIPAENLVRDFRYNVVQDPIDRNTPPLRHAFEYYKKGDYNRGDPNHTNDVKRKGKQVMSTGPIKEWVKNSELARRALSIK